MLICNSITFSQNLYFQSYTSTEGLSQNSIYSIAETPEGFMWFGTQDGINRFDGKKFKSFIPVMETTEGTVSNFSKMITTLYHDRQDHLWVGTTRELLLYDRYTGKFGYPHDVYPGFKLPSDIWIKKIIEDTYDNLWIITQDNGIFCYNKSARTMKSVLWESTAPKKMLNIMKDSKGVVWVASNTDLYYFDNGTFFPVKTAQRLNKANITIADICLVNNTLWTIVNSSEIVIFDIFNKNDITHTYFDHIYSGKTKLADARILHQSDSNTVWVGSRSDGLLKVNLKDKTYIKAGAAGTSYSLVSQFILSFYTNKQFITWIGLSGGLAKYDVQKVQFGLWRNEPESNKPAPDNKIFSILGDTEEDFYMGTLYGGMMHCNIKTNKFKYYPPPFNIYTANDSKTVYEIIKGNGNLLWMATKGGLYSFDKISKKFEEFVDHHDDQTRELTVLLKLKDQNKLLVAGYNGGLRLFNLDTKKWEKCYDKNDFLKKYLLRARHMKEVEPGVIYMSTEAQNLVKYDYRSGVFTTFPTLQKVSGISRHFWIVGDDCWVATDDGLIQANVVDMTIKKIWRTENGLPNNYIYAVVPDNYGRLWISSNQGLALLDVKKGIIRKFSKDDGLQDLEFNTASCFKDKKGKIWFGGINGFNMVNPDLTVNDIFSPGPLITGINVMNLSYSTGLATSYVDSVHLTHDKNFISFEFQSPNFSQTENIAYQYMLSGVDSSWVNSGTRNFVSYTQLKPGAYTFSVKSANNNNIWCDQPKALFIYISPPWYKTIWFLTTAAGLFLFLLFYLIKQRIKTIKSREFLKRQKAEAEMKALRSQMNPHFIFNSLNSINSFVVENKTHLASDYLTKFSRLIRLILDNSGSEEIPLEKEIETLKLYLLMESLRFENKFDYEIFTDQNLDTTNIMIPPMVIQPYVENAIWHGLMHKPDHGKVSISITSNEAKPSDLIIKIADNGIGRDRSGTIKSKTGNQNKSYGTDITFQRIRYFNPINTVKINDLFDSDNMPAGTEVMIYLYSKIK